MANEILRFIISRPAQSAPDKPRTAATTKAYPDGDSALVGQVRQAPDRPTARKMLKAWLEDLAHQPNPGDPTVAIVIGVRDLFARPPRPSGELAFKKIDDTAKAQGLSAWRDASVSARFVALRTLLADRLLAQVLLGSPDNAGAADTIRLFRASELVIAASQAGTRGLPRTAVDRIARTRPMLPNLALGEAPRQSTTRPSTAVADRQRLKADRDRVRADVRQAIHAMKALAARNEREHDLNDALTPERSPARGLFGGYSPKPETPRAAKPWLDQLPTSARTIAEQVVADPQAQSLSAAIADMERHAQQMATPSMTNPSMMAGLRRRFGAGAARMGPRFLFGGALAPPALDAQPTVPQGIGELGTPRRGDLVIVRQDLARYQLGEIAHIENVLQGETHERTFARNQTSETVLTTARETSTTEERDTQSTERFELSSAMKEAVDDHLKLEAGVSVSASYGPTVGVEANSQFGYEHAQEQSKEAASSFAREMTSSAKSKVETRVAEQRMTRSLTEVRELTRHAIDNAAGGGHTRGLYRFVDKVYRMQVVNYGIRDLYELYVPEPAAFIRHLNNLKAEEPLEIPEPTAPTAEDVDTGEVRPLTPDDLDEQHYADYVAQTGARDVAAPPPLYQTVSAVLQASVEGDKPISAVNSELMIPDGYVSTALKFNGAGHKANTDNFFWNLEISGRNFQGRNSAGGEMDRGKEIDFDGRVGKVPFAVVTDGYDQLAVTMWMRCERTPEAFRAWQLSTYAAIIQGYQMLKAAYDEKREAAQADMQAQIAGRAPAANLEFIRNELKRVVITLMTAQRFELFDSMRPPADEASFPEIALADARAEGRYVAFVEQAFEWENMTYVLYPYFWGRKAEWTVTSQLDDVDDRFAKFLKAGFARVQVPVRPGSEALVSFTFDPNNWSGQVWTQADPPGFEREGTMTIEDEMRSQTGGIDHVQGPGRISIAVNDTVVTGVDTAFTEDDQDRELRVDAITYHIVEVTDATHVRIETPGPTQAVASALYSLGPKLVGPPWELTVPTTLVYLQADAALNP